MALTSDETTLQRTNSYSTKINLKGLRHVYRISHLKGDNSNNGVPWKGAVPHTHQSTGPFVERPITLPSSIITDQEEMDSTHARDQLLQQHQHTGNILSNGGVINPTFHDVTMRDNDVIPSSTSPNFLDIIYSDVSSIENLKSSDREENDISSDSSEQVRRRSVPGRSNLTARDSYSSQDSLDGKSAPWKTWDVFRVVSGAKDVTLDDQTISKCRKILKVFVGLFLTIGVLLCTLIAKTSLLLISSNIYVNVTLFCHELPGGRHFTFCARVRPEKVSGTVYRLSQNVEVRWIWAMFVLIVTPYMLTFIKCLWRVCFKRSRRPSLKACIAVFTTETLASIGVSIFAFQVLPNTDSLRGLVLMLGVTILPSIFKLFDREDENGRSFVTYVTDVFAVLIQLSVLVIWPVHFLINDTNIAQAWGIPVSLLLISCGYWENYINKYTTFGFLGQKLKDLKKQTRRMRTKIYLFVSLWKIVVTLLTMTAIISDFHSQCAKVLYFFGDNGVKGCPHLVYPYNIANVEAKSYFEDPFWVMLVQIFASLLCYSLAKTACKTLLQVGSFALPLTLSLPILLGTLISDCEAWKGNSSEPYYMSMPTYLFWNCEVDGNSSHYLRELLHDYYYPITVAWWLSFVWVTSHVWFPRVEKLVQTERLFVQPLYCGVFLEQGLMVNRRRDDRDRESKSEKKQALQFFQAEQQRELEMGLKPRGSLRTDITPMIYVCATMWHETDKEMAQILTSIFRMDLDQCTRKHAFVFFDVVDPSYYEFEAHIFFDDAFDPHDDDDYEFHVNRFVKSLVRVIDKAASAVHRAEVKMDAPTKYPTPYGGRLEWTLPGHNKLTVHMKDKMKIRHKKRWSQVMYMYYLLGHRLVAQKLPDARRKQTIADNTYLLTLDGDVDFKPSAVQLLVDRMKKNEKVGAACGRIHPTGSGPMVWYQKFEYAVSHWLQKATEHMIGCVLCSPGCFSLFRASALMDDNVMRMYATTSTEARHYVQYDQGEDRWLCTLLLQQGYRVEYCAAADALTYCPEGFDEFYNQRRRWTPSTMANIMDILMSWRLLIRKNDNFSTLYVLYQLLLFVSSLLTPATIFLLIVGAFNTAFKEIDLVDALFINLSPVLFFLVICLFARTKIQLAVAGVLSICYALLMMIVVVGLVLEMKKDGICAPTTVFTICITGIFVISALMHPLEFSNIFHGLLYFLAVPSMSMLLMIYSITNLNIVSWGTREVNTQQQQAQAAAAAEQQTKGASGKLQSLVRMFNVNWNQEGDADSEFGFSCGNLFRCLCCPQPKRDEGRSEETNDIMVQLDRLEKTLEGLKNPDTNTDITHDDNTPEGTLKRSGARTGSMTRNSASSNSQTTASTADATTTTTAAATTTTSTATCIGGNNNKETGTSVSTSDNNAQTIESMSQMSGEDNVKENPLYRETVSPYEAEFSPFWLQDRELGHGNIRYLGTEEMRFWKDFIQKYLYPVVLDKPKQAKLEYELRQLRNKASLMFFLLNALFVVIIFALQYTNAAEQGNGLAIPLPCTNDEGKNLTLEPISMLFMGIFGIAIVVQFIAMFFHRLGTFLHIVSSTEVNCMKLNQTELAALDISDKLELVQQMQKFDDDDDDTRSEITSTSRETAADESSFTDESPKLGRRKTVLRLTRKRKRQEQKGSNMANRFMERYLKLAKDLRHERISDRSKRSRTSSKKKRKSRRALEAIERSNKSSVLLKAHKWQSINRNRTIKSSASIDSLSNDPWVNLVKGVFSQSRSSLNTLSEEDARNGGKGHRRKNTWSGEVHAHPVRADRERGAKRASYGGRRSSFNVLSAVKEVSTTPGNSSIDVRMEQTASIQEQQQQQHSAHVMNQTQAEGYGSPEDSENGSIYQGTFSRQSSKGFGGDGVGGGDDVTGNHRRSGGGIPAQLFGVENKTYLTTSERASSSGGESSPGYDLIEMGRVRQGVNMRSHKGKVENHENIDVNDIAASTSSGNGNTINDIMYGFQNTEANRLSFTETLDLTLASSPGEMIRNVDVDGDSNQHHNISINDGGGGGSDESR